MIGGCNFVDGMVCVFVDVPIEMNARHATVEAVQSAEGHGVGS